MAAVDNSANPQRRLVLLGGGHAHVHVLQDLARQPIPDFAVTMITPFARQMYSGMVPGLVAGHYTADQASIALPPLAQAAGVTMLQDAAVGLDAGACDLQLQSGGRVSYDLLSIDTGAVMRRDEPPGADEHALFVRPIEHFVQGLDTLLTRESQGGEPLDIVVVGGGAAGVELAMALQHRMRQAAPRPGQNGSRVALLTGGEAPLAGYPAEVMQRAADTLKDQHIAVFLDTCIEVRVGHLMLGSGARLACDTAVLATGAQSPTWLQGSGLALDGRGFVQTGATLQSRSHANVFAVGDVSSRVDVQHPRSGVYAVRAGPPLVANLRLWVAGQSLKAHTPQQRTLNLISCGQRSAIVSWGNWSAQGRWAWWWKDHIDRAFIKRYSRAMPLSTQPA